MQQKIIDFLNSYNYDIRISHNARWIDQKCTPDVISIIADCILEYTEYNTEIEFSVSDIWHSQYARENILAIFSKPDTNSDNAKHEYDKFFGQPIKLLAYSHILIGQKKGNKYIYKIGNLDLLEYIMQRDTNALTFLILYIQKVLKDSDIYNEFEYFFINQDKNSFHNLKNRFINFTTTCTDINTSVECGRIFTKILNPLAFKLQKKGTKKGHISNTIITIDELRYNRINWRDELSNKDKTITRKEHYYLTNTIKQATANYYIQKAKKIVRKYNKTHNNDLSEIRQINETLPAAQIHHIFPVSKFPSICDYLENLIALTPNQHFSMAHPNNQTMYIDRDFQYICLLAKTTTIIKDYECSHKKIYSFNKYKIVLNTGLNTNDFNAVCYLDFITLLTKIDLFYSDFNKQQYEYLINDNRPKIQ